MKWANLLKYYYIFCFPNYWNQQMLKGIVMGPLCHGHGFPTDSWGIPWQPLQWGCAEFSTREKQCSNKAKGNFSVSLCPGRSYANILLIRGYLVTKSFTVGLWLWKQGASVCFLCQMSCICPSVFLFAEHRRRLQGAREVLK